MSKCIKLVGRLRKGQKGLTGLETAIILIAFVTVAAVFGYAVLSAGLFGSEKAKESVYAGLEAARASMEIKGAVIAEGDAASPAGTEVTTVTITVGNGIAGLPIDLTANAGTGTNTLVAAYRDSVGNIVADIEFSVAFVGKNNGNDLLEAGEQAQIIIDLSTLGGQLTTPLVESETFQIELKPRIGATVVVERTIPAAIDLVMDLH